MREGRAGLESSDISDKYVLEKTTQTKNQQGHIQFKFKCEDDHIIQSEWINPDMARKALMSWCDTVRGVLVSRAEDQAAQKRAAKQAESPKLELPPGIEGVYDPEQNEEVLKKRADLDLPPDDEDEEDLLELATTTPVKRPKPKTKVIVPEGTTDDDPVLTHALSEYRKAKAAMEKWAKVIKALEE